MSFILGGILANALFETPNVVGGGAAKMVAAIFLTVIFKVVIEFFLARWQKRRRPGADQPRR